MTKMKHFKETNVNASDFSVRGLSLFLRQAVKFIPHELWRTVMWQGRMKGIYRATK